MDDSLSISRNIEYHKIIFGHSWSFQNTFPLTFATEGRTRRILKSLQCGPCSIQRILHSLWTICPLRSGRCAPSGGTTSKPPGLQGLGLQKGGQVGLELTLHRGTTDEPPTKLLTHSQCGRGSWWVAGRALAALLHGRGCHGGLVDARLVRTLHTTMMSSGELVTVAPNKMVLPTGNKDNALAESPRLRASLNDVVVFPWCWWVCPPPLSACRGEGHVHEWTGHGKPYGRARPAMHAGNNLSW